jgi:hypothetical protein
MRECTRVYREVKPVSLPISEGMEFLREEDCH